MAPARGASRALQRGRLIVGVRADYAPWGMVDPGTEGLIGLEPNLARDLADRLDVDLELVAVTSANRLQRLDSGVVDVVIATTGDTEERRGIADLIQPHYYSSGVALFARPESVFTDWAQLRGRSVCLTRGPISIARWRSGISSTARSFPPTARRFWRWRMAAASAGRSATLPSRSSNAAATIPA